MFDPNRLDYVVYISESALLELIDDIAAEFNRPGWTSKARDIFGEHGVRVPRDDNALRRLAGFLMVGLHTGARASTSLAHGLYQELNAFGHSVGLQAQWSEAEFAVAVKLEHMLKEGSCELPEVALTQLSSKVPVSS